ncbi:MAG: hypothetical protein KY475_22225 [Planctomycetes bacterium]|nr:hypothetical protein [Planctomycetota bacterium]
MRRFLICGSAAVFAMGAIAVFLGDVAEADKPPPNSSIEPAPPDVAARVAELVELRRDLGASPLEGSLLDKPAGESEFAEALRREFGTAAPGSPARVHEFPAAPRGDAALTAALRRAATLLDEKANRVEVVEAYSEADGYRRLARRLRCEARRLASVAP